MATKIGDLFFDVYADVSRAAKNIDDFTGKVSHAGTVAARAIGETIANAVGIAAGATAVLTAATLHAGVAYNTLGQSASAAFTSIYNDVNASREILAEISRLDLETPFQGKALVATARTLAGFGFELGDVVNTTEALAQATAAMGLGSDALHRMAIAFGQIQSRGKLAGDEARQLANYGIDAYGLLADKLGLSVAAVRELGQEGKLTADIVIPALVESINTRFSGATEALFNTAAGQAEGLRSVMEGVGSALIEPFIGFAGGGAFVEAMGAVREELVNLVSVAEDGSFRLQGFLAPLEPIMQSLADVVAESGEAFANFLGSLDENTLPELAAHFEGLGPLIAGAGAALATIFAQAIPFVGRFVAGFNPIIVGLTTLALTSDEIREALADSFMRISDAVRPLIPEVKELVQSLMDIVEQGAPKVIDELTSAFEALTPPMKEALEAANDLVDAIGPSFVVLVGAAAEAIRITAEAIASLPPDLVLMAGALYGLTVIFPTVTTSLIASTAAMGMAGGAAATLATNLGLVATAAGLAFAAVGSFNAIQAGATGDLDYLNRDVAFYEKPFQLAGRFGFALGGGDREEVARTAEMNRLLEEGEVLGTQFARAMEDSGLSMAEFSAEANDLLPTQEAINFALINYREILDEIHRQQQLTAQQLFNERTLYDDVGEGIKSAVGAQEAYQESLEEEIDLLEQLGNAARLAWDEVDRLSMAGADSTVDDFLRSLPDLARDLTDALGEAQGPLRDLNISGALDQVQQDAIKVINVLSQEYGLSMEQIKSYFDERGLAGVIAALGTVTEETTETVDPLIAKYASLGATAGQLQDAIDVLRDRRQAGIEAEIDRVQAALEGARQAAEDAQKAVLDFLSGGYLDSPQAAVDDLISNIGNLGSQIEDGLRMGGVRGEAAVRQALGGVSSGIAEVVNAGFEAGLSGQEIVNMLQPVFAAIGEETSDAARRIMSLDWSAGFTPAAADDLRELLTGIMDPGQIDSLLAGLAGTDTSALERRLDELQASLHTEVEFSPEQVQGALAEIQTTVSSRAVITPEAAQLVYDAIQEVFDNDELQAAVDKAVITQDIMDAAQDAEDQVNLIFESSLSFNNSQVNDLARMVSEEFYQAFNQRMSELRDEAARAQGFESFPAMQAALGPAVAGAIVGGIPTVTTNVNNDITINETSGPRQTAQEVIAASSAAAGAGTYDPSKYANRGTFNPRLS